MIWGPGEKSEELSQDRSKFEATVAQAPKCHFSHKTKNPIANLRQSGRNQGTLNVCLSLAFVLEAQPYLQQEA